jgi:HSP20 family protein
MPPRRGRRGGRERRSIMAGTATVPAKTEPARTEPPTTTAPKLRGRDPFEMIESFQDEMARMWGQAWPFGGWPRLRRAKQTPEGTAMWTPRVDVFEKNGELVVKAELPGMKKEDIEVTLDQKMLVMRGHKQAEQEVKAEHYYRMEQSYGSFYRRLPLPFETTPEAISATYTGGILEIHIPKPAAETEPTKQTITIT